MLEPVPACGTGAGPAMPGCQRAWVGWPPPEVREVSARLRSERGAGARLERLRDARVRLYVR